MDVHCILDATGASQMVETPCDATVGAVKEVACEAFNVQSRTLQVCVCTEGEKVALDDKSALRDTPFDGEVYLCQREVNVLCPHQYPLGGPCRTFAISADGGVCMLPLNNGVHLINTETFETVRVLNPNCKRRSIALSPFAQWAYFSEGICGLTQVDMNGKVRNRTHETSLEVTTNEKYLVSRHLNGVNLYTLDDLQLTRQFTVEGECSGVSSSPNGKYLALCTTYECVVYEVEPNTKLWSADSIVPITAIALSPCGHKVAVAGIAVVLIMRRGEDRFEAIPESLPSGALAFSPCGRCLVCGGDWDIVQVDVATRDVVKRSGSHGAFRGIAVSSCSTKVFILGSALSTEFLVL